MSVPDLHAGDRVRMEAWVTPAHLRVLGISDPMWVKRFLEAELLVTYPDDGCWRSCGRVAQVTVLNDVSFWLPLNIKYCYLRRADGRPLP